MLDDVSSIDKKDDDSFHDCNNTSSSNHGDNAVLMNRKSNDIRITRQRILVGYLVAFNILGILLHPNFYPWT